MRSVTGVLRVTTMYTYLNHLAFVQFVFSLAGFVASGSTLQPNPNTSQPTIQINKTLASLSVLSSFIINIPGTDDLSLDIEYGKHAPPARWDEIREYLDDLQRRLILKERAKPYGSCLGTYSAGFATLIFPVERLEQGGSLAAMSIVSCTDSLRYMNAVRDLLLTYKDPPREINAKVMRRGKIRAHMELHWNNSPNTWPEGYGFSTFVPANMQLVFLWKNYGRDLDPSDPSSVSEVEDALGFFVDTFRDEGPGDYKPNQAFYIHAFVRLNIKLPDTPATRIGRFQVTRSDMISAVNEVKKIFFAPHNYGPREFTAELWREDPFHGELYGKLALVSISFVDP